MTTTERHVCRRCRGSGQEPDRPQYNARQNRLLDRLAELGEERGQLQRSKAYTATAGRLRLDSIYAQIRKLVEDGKRMDILAIDMFDAIGVNSSAFYKKTGPFQRGALS